MVSQEANSEAFKAKKNKHTKLYSTQYNKYNGQNQLLPTNYVRELG